MNTFNKLFTTENDYWQYNKPKYEIAFLISDQHLIITGGIGQYAKAFYDMCIDMHIRVHFILDKEPSREYHKIFDKAVFHFPDNAITYTLHAKTYLHTDTMNMYKQANFHTAIVKAKEYIGAQDFDLYICNTCESIMPAYIAGCTPLVIYTHLYRHIHKTANPGKFSNYFHNIVDTLSNLEGVYVATQSLTNKKILLEHHKKVIVLPISLPESQFLEKYDRTNTNGVLFVGRYEEGKRPEKFLKICKEANVPVKILTSKKSAEKFKDKCTELGLKYEIRHNLLGQEKVDFMLSSSIMLNVSKYESFSISTLECIGHMPVLTLDDQVWTQHFDKRYLIVCNKKNIVSKVKQYHDRPYTEEILPKSWYQNGSLDYVNDHEHNARDHFDHFLELLKV